MTFPVQTHIIEHKDPASRRRPARRAAPGRGGSAHETSDCFSENRTDADALPVCGGSGADHHAADEGPAPGHRLADPRHASDDAHGPGGLQTGERAAPRDPACRAAAHDDGADPVPGLRRLLHLDVCDQRRLSDHLRSADHSPVPRGREGALSAPGSDAGEYRRRPRQPADALRQPAEPLSLWAGGGHGLALHAPYASALRAFRRPADLLHSLSLPQGPAGAHWNRGCRYALAAGGQGTQDRLSDPVRAGAAGHRDQDAVLVRGGRRRSADRPGDGPDPLCEGGLRSASDLPLLLRLLLVHHGKSEDLRRAAPRSGGKRILVGHRSEPAHLKRSRHDRPLSLYPELCGPDLRRGYRRSLFSDRLAGLCDQLPDLRPRIPRQRRPLHQGVHAGQLGLLPAGGDSGTDSCAMALLLNQ